MYINPTTGDTTWVKANGDTLWTTIAAATDVDPGILVRPASFNAQDTGQKVRPNLTRLCAQADTVHSPRP